MYKSWKLRNKEVNRKINVLNFILKVSWNKHMYVNNVQIMKNEKWRSLHENYWSKSYINGTVNVYVKDVEPITNGK